MYRFDGSCEPVAEVDVTSAVHWINGIAFEEWPQQVRLADGGIRPAMVSDPEWFGFYARTDAIINALIGEFPECIAGHRLLSVVMPGHEIEPHIDERDQRCVCRVHVPLVSSDCAILTIDGVDWNMLPGMAYKINTELEHAIVNRGSTPRIHFIFDVRSGIA